MATTKCAHPGCSCQVTDQNDCSDRCKAASPGSMQIPDTFEVPHQRDRLPEVGEWPEGRNVYFPDADTSQSEPFQPADQSGKRCIRSYPAPVHTSHYVRPPSKDTLS